MEEALLGSPITSIVSAGGPVTKISWKGSKNELARLRTAKWSL